MKNIFRTLLIGLSLLAVPTIANAQAVHREGGVATTKSVTAQEGDGNYTIKLETWAEGETAVVETATPVDVVLVLDVSGSMDFPKGSVTAETRNFSYNDIANSEYTYFYLSEGSYWKVYPSTTQYYGNTYYHLTYYPGNPTHIGNNNAYSTNPNAGLGNRTLYRGTETRMDALKKAVNSFIEDIERDDHQDKEGP